MELLILSFFAGVLTVAAPCILPLLPVIVGGTALTDSGKKDKAWFRPLVIAVSLALSVVTFTLILKATTALLGVPQGVWSIVSGGIVLLFGLNLLFPVFWERFMTTSGLQNKTNELLGTSYKKNGVGRDILLGASLGPVFSSCSPTYALIVAAVLPQSFAKGFVYLLAYAIGLASILLLIGVAGQGVVQRMGWLANPHGWFKRIIGISFVIVGLAVLFGFDKDVQSYVLENGYYDPVMRLEQRLNIE